jgi:hypothetical protein
MAIRDVSRGGASRALVRAEVERVEEEPKVLQIPSRRLRAQRRQLHCKDVLSGRLEDGQMGDVEERSGGASATHDACHRVGRPLEGPSLARCERRDRIAFSARLEEVPRTRAVRARGERLPHHRAGDEIELDV